MKELTYVLRLGMLLCPSDGRSSHETSNIIVCFTSVAFEICKIFEKQEASKICQTSSHEIKGQTFNRKLSYAGLFKFYGCFFILELLLKRL